MTMAQLIDYANSTENYPQCYEEPINIAHALTA